MSKIYLFRLISLLLLFTFSFEQMTFAFSSGSLTPPSYSVAIPAGGSGAEGGVSRARLTLTEDRTQKAEDRVKTVVGELDPFQVQSYGGSDKEESEITKRAVTLAAERAPASLEEEKLETRHLETLAQKTFRKLLGRDPAETGSSPELSQMTEKLRSLNSQSRFENYLKADYNKDSSGLSEHDRRTGEIRGIINSVYEALRIYFGFSSGALSAEIHEKQ